MYTIVILIAALIAIFILYDKFIAAPARRREAEVAPRITLAEAEGFWDAVEADTLPIARAHVQDDAPSRPDESRIGGAPLAIEDGAPWPIAADGRPMTFLAQINFADMPALEGFPGRGLLQIFTSFEAEDWDRMEMERVIRWEAEPQTGRLLDIPQEIRDPKKWSGHFSHHASDTGLPLLFEAGTAPGNPYNWPYTDTDLAAQNRLPESDAVARIMAYWEDRAERILDSYGTHWIGGHPSFVQFDVREAVPELRLLTRVLLHLGFDEHINIGDAGQLNVMISEADLAARNFKSAYLTWDCS